MLEVGMTLLVGVELQAKGKEAVSSGSYCVALEMWNESFLPWTSGGDSNSTGY